MKESFTQAYDSLMKLRNKQTNKVCFIFSSYINRIRQLVDFFEHHSNFSVSRFSLSEISKIISTDGKTMKSDAKNYAVRFLKKTKSEYIILEDNGDLSKSFFLMDDLCEVIREVGKRTAVIVVSEHAGEFSLLYGEAVMVDVPGLNERSLKIKPSTLQIEELYLRNQYETITSGVFWANNDFYSNFLKNKISGDEMFAQGKYQEAFEKYNDAISFHSKNYEDESPIHDFLGITLYIRCIACFLYGKWPERTNANQYMKESVDEILLKLKKSGMADLHGKMLKDYDLTFLGLRDGWLEKKNYLLFLNEYIF